MGDNLYRIDIERIHSGLNFRSKQNKLWNLRTVLMMVRAGVLELDADLQNPPDKKDFADVNRYEAAKEQIIRQNGNSLVVRILRSHHTGEELWKTRIIPSREETLQAARANHNALINWLHTPLSRPLCEALVDLYSMAEFIPGHACGGCPACRDNQALTSNYPSPPTLLLNPPASVAQQALSRWQALSGLSYSSCFITYPPVNDDEWERENWYHRIATLLVQLYHRGIVQRVWADPAA